MKDVSLDVAIMSAGHVVIEQSVFKWYTQAVCGIIKTSVWISKKGTAHSKKGN